MPYIPTTNRYDIARGRQQINTAGELTYKIYVTMLRYIENHGKSYQTLLEAHGAATMAAAELYRRVVGPYEDTKIAENGDVTL